MARFLLFVIPATFWDDRPRATPPTVDELLREQLREAKALRERIAGGVNLESERTRFTDTVGRVEATLLRRSRDWPDAPARDAWDEASLREDLAMGRFPALRLGDDYLHLLAQAELARSAGRTPGITVPVDALWLGGSVYRADQLAGHLKAVAADLPAIKDLPAGAVKAATDRIAFYELVAKVGGHGVVEVQVVQDGSSATASPAVPRKRAASGSDGKPSAGAAAAPLVSPEADVAPNPSRRRQMVDRLHADVAAAVAQFAVDGRGGKVNASNQPHEVTTDVFGEWVRRGGPPVRVRIVYADASEAAPFPLCCLSGHRPPAGEPRTIRAALMSMRHLEIDRVVDMAWYRNREVSQSRSLAEADEFCFAYSLGELKRLAALSDRLKRPIRLHVYHTGFEPASTGFYRAVVAVLTGDEAFQAGWAQGRESWLIVVPHYYRGGAAYEPSAARDGSLIEWY